MCGRYATTRSVGDLSALFDAVRRDRRRAGARLQRRADRPGADRAGHRPRGPAPGRCSAWPAGGWCRPGRRTPAGAARMINARAETVATSRAFARSFAAAALPGAGRRLVRVGAGTGGGQAAVLHDPRRRRVAGLRRHLVGVGPGDGRLLTFSVLTLPAVGRPGRGARPDAAGAAARRGGRPGWPRADATGLLAPPPPEYAAGIEIRPVGAGGG